MALDDERRLGLKIIQTAVKIEESLAELLKFNVTKMKKLSRKKGDESIEEIFEINKVTRNIIIALTLTDERIRMGLELIKPKKNNN